MANKKKPKVYLGKSVKVGTEVRVIRPNMWGGYSYVGTVESVNSDGWHVVRVSRPGVQGQMSFQIAARVEELEPTKPSTQNYVSRLPSEI